jgi:propanediol dehydratase small subunit
MGRLCAVVLAVLLLAACSSGSSSTAHVAACKAAMTRDYHYALAHPDAPPAAKPAACKGVPDATLQKLAAEIMASP